MTTHDTPEADLLTEAIEAIKASGWNEMTQDDQVDRGAVVAAIRRIGAPAMTTHDTPEAARLNALLPYLFDLPGCPARDGSGDCTCGRDEAVGFATNPAVPVDAGRLRKASQALLDAISAAEATGWTWAGGAEWVSLDDPAYRLPSEMQQAQANLATALTPAPSEPLEADHGE